MTKTVLIEQYFYPDGWGGAEIPRDIAIALRQAGFAVDVLCGTEQYAPVSPDEVVANPESAGIRILRIPRLLPGSVRRFKFLRVLWFCFCAFPVLLVRRDVGLLITQTNPPLVVPIVALVAAIRRLPFVIIAQDIYPEVLFASGALQPRSLLGRVLRRLFSWAFRRAERVITLGPFMERRVLAKGVSRDRIVTISNWATGEIRRERGVGNPLRAEWSLSDRFVVLYSGNLGIGHEFETFLQGVRQASAAEPRIHAVFIGSGSRLAEVRKRTADLGLADRTLFRNFVPASVLPISLGLADLALVTLRPGFEGVIAPSKLLGYMARGIPTLYIGPDSDIADLIRNADCGVCCLNGRPQEVAETLLRAARDDSLLQRWSHNGADYYARHLDRTLALSRYVHIVREAADTAEERVG